MTAPADDRNDLDDRVETDDRAVLEIVRPGALCTVQDLGRPGLGRFGVTGSGAMDRVSHRLACALVGNADEAAALELTGPGAELRFLASWPFAIAGGDLGATLDGVALPCDFAGTAAAGARLRFSARRAGARACLALRGELAVARWSGSAATDLGGGLAATGIVPLRAGARLSVVGAARVARGVPAAGLSHPALAALLAPLRAPASSPVRLRYLAEPEGGTDPAAQAALAARAFRTSERSSRIGLRFEGEPLPVRPDPARWSEPTAPGALQLPPDGLPILLMADRNTTGGYPRLGHLASVDGPRAAQLWPGDLVRFVAVTVADATGAARRAEASLRDVLRVLRDGPRARAYAGKARSHLRRV